MEEENPITVEVQILQSSMDVEVTPTVAMDPNKLGVRTLAPFISSISTQTDRELENSNNYNSVVLDENYVHINHGDTEEHKVDKSGFNWIATTTEMVDSSSDEDGDGDGDGDHNRREQQPQKQQQTVTERIKELTEEDLLLHSNDTVNLCFHESNPMEAIASGRHVSIVSNHYTLEMRNSQMANAAGCDYDVRSIVANKFSTRHLLPETNELDFVQATEATDQPTGTEAGLDLGLDLDLLSQMEDEDDRDTSRAQSVGVITIGIVDNEHNDDEDGDGDDDENNTVIENPSVNELIALHELNELNELNEFELRMGDDDYTRCGTKASSVRYSPSVSPRTRLAGITSTGGTPAMTTSALATPAIATATPTPVVPLRTEVRAIGAGAGGAGSTTPSPGPRYSPSHLFADIGPSRVAINAASPRMGLSVANATNLASITPTISPMPTPACVAGEVSKEAVNVKMLIGECSNGTDSVDLKRLQTLRVPSLSLMNASTSSWGSASAGATTATATATPTTPARSPASDSENENDEKAQEESSSSLRSIKTVEVINLRENKTGAEKRVSGVSGHGLDGLDGLDGLHKLDKFDKSSGGANAVNAINVAKGLIGPDGRVIARAAPKMSDSPPAPPVTREPSRHGKSNSHTRTNTNYGLIFANEQHEEQKKNQVQETNRNKNTDKGKDGRNSTTTNNRSVNSMKRDNSARMKTFSGRRIYHYRKNWTRPKGTKTTQTTKTIKTTMKPSDRHTVIVSGTKIIYPKSARYNNDNDTNKNVAQEPKRHTLPHKTAPPIMNIDNSTANNNENEESSDDEDIDIPFPDFKKTTGGNQSAPLTGSRYTIRRRSITRLGMGITSRPDHHTSRERKRPVIVPQPTIDEVDIDINVNDESMDSIGDLVNIGSGSNKNINGRRESSHIRMSTVQVVSTDVDSKRELIAALGKITRKFDSLFPFYRLSDKDCKHLSLMVFEQFDSINRIFCNAHGRYLEALIYYKGSLIPEKLAFFNYDDLWGEVKQWHDIKMSEKYCLTEMGFSPNDRRRTF